MSSPITPEPPRVRRHRFEAMGSQVDIIVLGGRRTLLASAQARIDDLERKWSRFIGTSEISAVNRSGGMPTAVSVDTLQLVRRALQGYEITDGIFDPTLLGAVLRAGYVDSFRSLSIVAHLDPAPPSRLHTGADRIEVDELAGTVRVPAGVGFDPGGIGKGLAADIVAEELAAAGAVGACVNIGGDVRVLGASPSGDGWRVGIEDPTEPSRHIARLHVHHGGVATSSRLKRAWQTPDGRSQHHLMDPRTDSASQSPALAATVVASEAWRAEVLAKAAFLGVGSGLTLIEAVGAAGMVVVPDGCVTTAGWADMCSQSPLESAR